MNAFEEECRCWSLIFEYQKRIRELRARIAHARFMTEHGAEADIQPRIEGYNDWKGDGNAVVVAASGSDGEKSIDFSSDGSLDAQ